MSITSFEVDPPAAYKVYRHYKDKCEDDWDGDIFLDKTLIHGEEPEAPPPPPPYVVVVQGPPNVGKSLLIKSLVKYFTNMQEHVVDDIRGPITILTGDGRRLQFVECLDDINAMIDASKYADLVLLLVDASYGFEAETFEFLNLLQAHGFPKVMGVLTHLDKFKDEKELNGTKERLVDNFLTEICQGAAISCISGLYRELYIMGEVQELAEHILMLQPRSSSWRAAHPYVLVDRVEDVTPPAKLHKDANCKRNITMYGYLRGCNIKSGAMVHLAGVGDFRLAGVTSTTDPFPLWSEMEKENDFVELTQVENESFITGTYLRLEVHDVPFQVVESFDSCHPILVGGISFQEEKVAHMQARLKRHNWHRNLLKSQDVVTVSAGWRRYQTKPIYAGKYYGKYDNGLHQILEYNPEHEHCLAMFWGPCAPPRTRIVVVHGTKEVFRIAAKAVVLDHKHSSKIMKKHRLEGKLHKILDERTALIKFESKYDVTEFEGSPIWTGSGILGTIDKVEKSGGICRFENKAGSPAFLSSLFSYMSNVTGIGQADKSGGIARCTFEKNISKWGTFIMSLPFEVVAPLFFKPCESTVCDNQNLLEKEDPARRRLRRRRVDIIDGEPCSHPDTSYFTWLISDLNMKNKRKETVVVMSKEKRVELINKKQREESDKLNRIGLSKTNLYY